MLVFFESIRCNFLNLFLSGRGHDRFEFTGLVGCQDIFFWLVKFNFLHLSLLNTAL